MLDLLKYYLGFILILAFNQSTYSQCTTFSYGSVVFCQNDTDPLPDVDVLNCPAGDFISTDGLIIDATTGQIDLSASTPGTYTIYWLGSSEFVESHTLDFDAQSTCLCPATFTTAQTNTLASIMHKLRELLEQANQMVVIL